MDKIVVLDFGGQYCHLISRRIRDLGVFSEVLPSDTKKEELNAIPDLKGIILSGGAKSVYDKNSPRCEKGLIDIGVPIFGICYGHQLIAYIEGGEVISGESGEYGVTELKISGKSELLSGLNNKESVWMNHRDIVKNLPNDYSAIASTANSSIAAFEKVEKKIFGAQFHPEVTHTENGKKILENFAFSICNARKEWVTSNIVENITKEIKRKIGNKKAIIGLSGGVDSSTAAALVSKSIGKNLVAVHVDTGLLQQEEIELIERAFGRYDLNLKVIRASERFFNALKGLTAPEEKRKIIGKLYVEIFEEVARKEKAEILIQGTIYSDRIESGITEHSSKIKSHHNVGGLPEKMGMAVYEPLCNLYKDEVRSIAKEIGLPDEISKRQAFPGPGLAIRIGGEVTPEKVDIARRANQIVEEELKRAGLYEKLYMGFAILLPVKTVGVQGDTRTYKYPVVVRAIESSDVMTANFSKIPYRILERISTRITNEIKEVNRVLYDISNKPPSTMEWE